MGNLEKIDLVLYQWFSMWALPLPRGRWRDLGGGKKKGGDWGAIGHNKKKYT